MNDPSRSWNKMMPYIVGGVCAVAVYLVPEARPIACGVVAAAIPLVA